MMFINFKIKNVEPLKLTKTVKGDNYESSKSYISGANIRGAFINNYMNIKKINLLDDKDKKILLKGDLKFLNAYPILNENYTTVPVLEKDDKNSNDLNFVGIDFKNKKYKSLEIAKFSNVHINKNTKNKVFRYGAVRENNIFKGCIISENEADVEMIKEILQKGNFYIGGAKGSGYGQCIITDIQEKKESSEELILPKQISKKITLLAMSDILLRDNFAGYSSEIPEKTLKEALNVSSVKLINQDVLNDFCTGYNSKWGCNIPNVKAIKAGSYFTYEIDGEINRKKFIDFLNKGIGERKNEGFGRVCVLNINEYEKIENQNINEKKYTQKPLIKKDSKEQMQILVNRIYRERLKSSIETKVLDFDAKIKNPNKLSIAQWSKLYNLMIIAEDMDYKEGYKKIEEYFNHIKQKGINTKLKNDMKHVKIENEILDEFIVSELKNNDKKYFYQNYTSFLKLGGYENSLTENEMYKHKIKVFKEQFRFYMRNAKG